MRNQRGGIHYGILTALTGVASVFSGMAQALVEGRAINLVTPVLLGAALFFGRLWVKGIEARLTRIENNLNTVAGMQAVLDRLGRRCPYLNGEDCGAAGPHPEG